MKPHDIERLSFKIIEEETGSHPFSEEQWPIVRRMIHTSADFDYLKTVRFHPEAITAGRAAIRSGKTIVTDTNMARVGLRKRDLAYFGVETVCLMADPRVAEIAIDTGTTRARAAVDAALAIIEDGIYVVGNAPTALLRLVERVKAKAARPALIVGLPVGFVNAVESKDALMELDCPYISNVGRKGGSNIAASVVNALAIMTRNQYYP